ncbi:MAG: hypothetical protein FD134_2241 [Gallionellaceae bacterium]|nr:MAG: hypothetical protein FD134_2241 [Gallionellaceae bacterium]
MKTSIARAITVALCFGMMFFAGAGYAKEPLTKERNRSHIELDPGNTGTYTGEAGKDNYIGNCKVIKSGGASVGFSESMPDWKDTFTDKEITQIVQYLREHICKCRYSAGK